MKYTSNGFILNRNTFLTLLSPLFFKNKKILISNHCQNLRLFEATFPIGLLAFEGSSHRFSTYKCIFGSLKLVKSWIHHSTLWQLLSLSFSPLFSFFLQSQQFSLLCFQSSWVQNLPVETVRFNLSKIERHLNIQLSLQCEKYESWFTYHDRILLHIIVLSTTVYNCRSNIWY